MVSLSVPLNCSNSTCPCFFTMSSKSSSRDFSIHRMTLEPRACLSLSHPHCISHGHVSHEARCCDEAIIWDPTWATLVAHWSRVVEWSRPKLPGALQRSPLGSAEFSQQQRATHTRSPANQSSLQTWHPEFVLGNHSCDCP